MASGVKETINAFGVKSETRRWVGVISRFLSSLKELARFSPVAAIGGTVILVLLLVGLFAPFIITHNPDAIELKAKLKPPSTEHYFGTDDLGRDIFSRTVIGARLSLVMGLVVVLIAGVVGSFVGVVGGYLGGTVDQIIMRSADAFLAFPSLILAMALAAAMGPGVSSAVIAIAVTTWPQYARLVRSVVLVIRETEYVLAARALGVRPLRIIFVYIIPNSFAPILVRATLDLGVVILLVAGLSFIGFGVQPPTAEWGAMVSTGRNFMVTHWWVATIPGLAILLSVTGFNLFGDGLRDWLDPRLRGE